MIRFAPQSSSATRWASADAGRSRGLSISRPCRVDLALPGVVGGAVYPERPGRRLDARPRCLPSRWGSRTARDPGHQAQPLSLHLAGEGGSLRLITNGSPIGEPVRPSKTYQSPEPSGSTRKQARWMAGVAVGLLLEPLGDGVSWLSTDVVGARWADCPLPLHLAPAETSSRGACSSRRKAPPPLPSVMSSVIATIERAQLRRVPSFSPGDRVKVHFQVIEGTRRRVQVFEGVVIKRQGHGARETFTVRKQSFGVGVERMFPCTRRRSSASSWPRAATCGAQSSTTCGSGSASARAYASAATRVPRRRRAGAAARRLDRGDRRRRYHRRGRRSPRPAARRPGGRARRGAMRRGVRSRRGERRQRGTASAEGADGGRRPSAERGRCSRARRRRTDPPPMPARPREARPPATQPA